MAFGRMATGKSAEPLAAINVTPLVDVMLVLLVIFMLAAPLLVGAVRVQLPQTQISPATALPELIEVTISATGQIFVRDAPQSEALLAQTLVGIATANPQAEIALRADTTVPYGRVAEVMGIAHHAGIHRIAFIANPIAATTPN